MPPEPELTYAFDDEPGLRRRKAGTGFAFVDRRGRAVDARTRRRIAKLAIPPAWTEVWISPDASGHIQATGRDARGRKQYIYHPAWRAWRENSKFAHVLEFAEALPKLRERVARDLGDRRLSRRLVLAAAVRVLDRTLMRVGNDEYARHNHSYGLTTLLSEHIELAGTRLRFSFRGKHGKVFEAEFSDRRVAAVLRRLEGLPGQHLFQFLDEGRQPQRITSDDVNDYIREATGGDFTAKDFRTWAATVLAVRALMEGDGEGESERKSSARNAVKQVAGRLGNTPAVCRSSYIHPEILASYLDGSLAGLTARLADADDEAPGMFSSELPVLRFLKRRARETEAKCPSPPLKEALRQSAAAQAS